MCHVHTAIDFRQEVISGMDGDVVVVVMVTIYVFPTLQNKLGECFDFHLGTQVMVNRHRSSTDTHAISTTIEPARTNDKQIHDLVGQSMILETDTLIERMLEWGEEVRLAYNQGRQIPFRGGHH